MGPPSAPLPGATSSGFLRALRRDARPLLLPGTPHAEAHPAPLTPAQTSSPLGTLPAEPLGQTTPPALSRVPVARASLCKADFFPASPQPPLARRPRAVAEGRAGRRLPGPGAVRFERPQNQNGAGWPGWGFYSHHILAVHWRPAPPRLPSPLPLLAPGLGGDSSVPPRAPARAASPWNIPWAAPGGVAPRPRPCPPVKRAETSPRPISGLFFPPFLCYSSATSSSQPCLRFISVQLKDFS